MTVSRPPLLRVGDEVEVGGAVHTVTGLSGSSARLSDVTGAEASMTLAELLSAPGFRMVTRPPAALPPRGLMDALPAEAADQALWWERHVVEVIAGVPPGTAAGTRPRPEYDPETRTLRQRELAKVGELAGLGRPVPLSTLQRLRLSYEKRGAWGLVDHRFAPRPGARTDKRVLEAIAQAVGEETDRSTGTIDRLRRRVEQILAGEHGIDPAEAMPSRATFYRLAAQAASGKHTFGSARTRRSQAKTPAGQFGTVTASSSRAGTGRPAPAGCCRIPARCGPARCGRRAARPAGSRSASYGDRWSAAACASSAPRCTGARRARPPCDPRR